MKKIASISDGNIYVDGQPLNNDSSAGCANIFHQRSTSRDPNDSVRGYTGHLRCMKGNNGIGMGWVMAKQNGKVEVRRNSMLRSRRADEDKLLIDPKMVLQATSGSDPRGGSLDRERGGAGARKGHAMTWK